MADLLSPLVTHTAKLLYDYLSSRLGSKVAEPVSNYEKALARHATEVTNWSSQVQIFGMTRPAGVGTETLPLSLTTIPRKFSGGDSRSKGSAFEEADLLSGGEHYVILGDPGSGKTTTLKRIVQKFIACDLIAADDRWNYPVVIVLRSLESDSIIEELGRIFGLHWSTERVKVSEEPEEYRTIRRVGSEYLDVVVANLLDVTGSVVFLDGLDEVPMARRNSLEGELERLRLLLSGAKIVLTCRSGDYTKALEGFAVVEICSLDVAQIEGISRLWLREWEDFMANLMGRPYLDLVTRPLFLCQLIVYFENTGRLPEKPGNVYQALVRLLLEDWDRRRGVKRSSKYSSFFPDEKLEFLSALAYGLTYRVKTKRFSRDVLASVYREIYPSFGLPREEAQVVAEELETHTGIIVQSGSEHYEFSHLSLQEYLCAYHMVRRPFSPLLRDYLSQYPAPVAIAVALSSDPAEWFVNIMKFRYRLASDYRVVMSFVSRLEQEGPRFSVSEVLGFAVLDTLFVCPKGSKVEVLDRFLCMSGIPRSLALALRRYRIEEIGGDPGRFLIRYSGDLTGKELFSPPTSGVISADVVRKFRAITRSEVPRR